MQIVLKQSTLRYILVPLNFLTLIGVLITTVYPFLKIPTGKFVPFVFWLFKPTLLIEIVLSTTVLIMGFTGATKYNKCWQGSFSFFLFLLVIISYFALEFCKGIDYSLRTVIPTIKSQGQYLDDIEAIYKEINCTEWNSTINGCETLIREKISEYSPTYQKFVFFSLIFLSFYTLINIFFFIFVSEFEDSQQEPNKIQEEDD